MSIEIPIRISNKSGPSPILKEQVSLNNGYGVFDVFSNTPINHGFQWIKPRNIAYIREPGYPSTEALLAVRNKVVQFTNDLGMNGDLSVLAHAVPGESTMVNINDKTILEDHGIQGLFTPEGNAFFTSITGLPLYSTMRDCTQTILYSESNESTPVVGLIHSGRAETDNKFPFNAIKFAIKTYGIDPKKIKLGIAPSLEPSHHEIQAKDFPNIIKNGKDWLPYIVHPNQDGPYYLDVRSNVADQFISAGVPSENIEVYLNGTYQSSREGYGFSYRRSCQENIPSYCFGIAVELK